jgi:single-stranded-DNA-specific exonuclease
MRAVAFGGAEWFDDLANCNEPLAFAFRPIINEFNGYRRVELQVTDWRKAAPIG